MHRIMAFLLLWCLTPAAFAFDINTADEKELQALLGIGPQKAQRIVQYRKIYGPFRSLEELDDVPGIGPKIIEKIERYLKHVSNQR